MTSPAGDLSSSWREHGPLEWLGSRVQRKVARCAELMVWVGAVSITLVAKTWFTIGSLPAGE